MRIPQLLLALVLASAGVLGVALSVPEATGGHGVPHAQHVAMLVGGDGAARLGGTLALGWAFGALQLAFCVACFALGLQRGGRLGALARPVWLGLAAYEALWAGFFWLYSGFVADPLGATRIGGFPAATLWMLALLWPFPLWFGWLYLRHFDGWVLSDADLARFRARVDELKAAPDGNADADAGEESGGPAGGAR